MVSTVAASAVSLPVVQARVTLLLISPNLTAPMLTVQAGLVPRIFAYLFDRIEQIQNKQVQS